MAVQAQHPSNVLLFSRGSPDKTDCCLPPHLGGLGLFDNHPHMLFNDAGEGNPRKRGRDAAAATIAGINETVWNQNHSIPIQSQHLVNYSQLHRNLRLAQQSQNMIASSSSSQFSSVLMDSFIRRQLDELDLFLRAQGEELKRTIMGKRQRHLRTLMNAAEESLNRRLREKDAEVEKVTRQNAELEARAAQLSVEAQVWQAKARAQEAAAATLQAQLQQAAVTGGGNEDGGLDGQAGDAESVYVDPERVISLSGASTATFRRCQSCRGRAARVVVLPCRHLCLCSECDPEVRFCPVCLQACNSSVEVFFC